MMTYTCIIIYPYNSSLISNFRTSSSIINHLLYSISTHQVFSISSHFRLNAASRLAWALATPPRLEAPEPWPRPKCPGSRARGIPPGPGCRRNRRNWESLRCWDGDGSKPWYLVNPKIAGKWMFIPLKIVLIGIDPYPDILAGWWWLTYPITMVNDDGYYMVIIYG